MSCMRWTADCEVQSGAPISLRCCVSGYHGYRATSKSASTAIRNQIRTQKRIKAVQRASLLKRKRDWAAGLPKSQQGLLATYLIPGCIGRGFRLGSESSSGGASGGAGGGIWKSGNLEIWEFGDLEIWRSGDLEIQKLGKYGDLEIQKFEIQQIKKNSIKVVILKF